MAGNPNSVDIYTPALQQELLILYCIINYELLLILYFRLVAIYDDDILTFCLSLLKFFDIRLLV
jgi:hypothetical protein